jgi:hypothetical protein
LVLLGGVWRDAGDLGLMILGIGLAGAVMRRKSTTSVRYAL